MSSLASWDARARADVALAGNPVFDAAIFREALSLFQGIPASTYCERSQRLLSEPDPKEKINVTGGVRQLSMSHLLFAAEPHGIVASTLYYFVTLCEGIVMPLLQELIELAVLEGNRGPQSKKGDYTELAKARENFGPALTFLATYCDGTLLPRAPSIAAAIKSFSTDRISNLRNAIAHYNFKIEVSTSDANKDPEFQAAAKKIGAPVISGLFDLTCQLLGLGANAMKLPNVPDPTTTRIRYEEALGKPLNKNSRSRAFVETRELISRVEVLGFSMLFALVERGAELAAKGDIKSYGCPCGDGSILVTTGTTEATCPACGAIGPV